MQDHDCVALRYTELPLSEMQQRAHNFADLMHARRSVRYFSDRNVPKELIDECLRAAASAPSGANRQPWHFVAISNPAVKHRIRDAAEVEERDFYERRAPERWKDALAPLGTDADKPFLDIAPWLIVVFYKAYDFDTNGDKINNYYPQESVGIASGMLITALHNCGLVTLTHTPSPMGFMNEILERPSHERAYLLLPVGYPAEDATVPAITRKSLDEVVSYF